MLRICEVCGKEFESKVSAECCSKNCYARRWRKNNPREKTVKKIGKCIICGKEFEQKRETHLCCSKKCRKKHYDEQNRIRSQKWREEHSEEIKKKRNKGKEKSNHEKIADIAIAARAEGLTYGQYVAKYMGRF